MADLSVNIAGLKLRNPVMTASGTYGSGKEYGQLIDLNRLGAICAKTVTLKPIAGNPPPRLWETPSGMLNSIGLQNDGIDAFIAKDIPFLARYDIPLIVSIAATSIDDFERLAKMLSTISEVDAIELNISCPNAKAGGMIFGSNEKLATEVVSKTRMASSKPVIVKLTPNTSDIGGIACACERAGADALSLINTIYGMAVDVGSFEPRLGSIVGGLSGPAVKPIAIRM
ncbi:MAG TPA: dihydroorotate dehydrogenase, partial [Actinobacteria bacterium]|nr:dihydroorotate dehydrogenase [Actinomycetota bacterium]